MKDLKTHIDTVKKVYFLGIGGIGMSAIARYFKFMGAEVFGYDKTKTALTRALEAEGIGVHYEEDISCIDQSIDLIIYTPAIPKTHAAWEQFEKLDVPIKKRAEVLGMISKSKRTIAIAGTHGKTSTSSITAHVLRAAGVDATAFVGGVVKNFESNFVYGASDWVVVEADEFDRSFMHLEPEIAVLLSMDADHLDIYGDHDAMRKTFQDFTMNIKAGGVLLIHEDLVGQLTLTWKKALLNKNILLYSFGLEAGWFSARSLESDNHKTSFEFYVDQKMQLQSTMAMPGAHNVSNATAALAVGSLLNLDAVFMAKALDSFKGVLRRFDYVMQDKEQVIIDDYAHHPSEIEAAISTAKDLYGDKAISVVFQPHLYSRTRDFMDEFAAALDNGDEVVLMPIYPARELPIEGIISEVLASKMKQPVQVLNHEQVKSWIEKGTYQVLLLLGAGNIDKIAIHIREQLKG